MDLEFTAKVWLAILVISCVVLALSEESPRKCRGCHGCRKPCGRED